jgi:glyoxylate reductase
VAEPTAGATRPRVFVTRAIPEAGLALVRAACAADVWEDELPPPRATILARARDCAGILALLTDRMDAALMDACPRLRVISNFAVGYDNVDVPAATARGILVGNTPEVLTETTADMAWTLLMAAARRVPEAIDYVRAGRWRTWGPRLLTGQDVHGATLGLIGLGRIGSAVARRARGFDMRVLYHDVARRPALEAELGVEYADLPRLLRESDFVSLHAPLNPETHHLINRDALAQMKPTAVLVNTARGPLIDSQALYDALRDGVIFAAGLDVTEPEPLPADSPLLGLANCLVVPHIASATVATRDRMAERAALNLIAGLRGELLPTHLNPQARMKRR